MELMFNKPGFLYLLVLVPVIIAFHFVSARYSLRKGILFANFEVMKRVSKKYSLNNHTSLLIIRVFVIIAISLILAQTFFIYEGVGDSSNYVIAIDNSMSMIANEQDGSRLDIAKQSSMRFIESFDYDPYFGVISFASVSKIHVMLTDDKYKVNKQISEISFNNDFGTNLGDAIVNGVNILIAKEGSKKLILISDGQTNSGVNLEEAINYANENKVVVYTIAIGNEDGSTIDNINVSFYTNEDLLFDISTSTDGSFFAVKNIYQAEDAFESIKDDKFQKLRINFTEPLLILLLFLLVIEFIFVKTIYKITP